MVFLGFQLLDAITTLLALRLGAQEGNFLVAHFMRWGPVMGLLIAKFLGFLLLVVACRGGRMRLLRLSNIWFACVVTWNLTMVLIQRLGGSGQ